VTNRRRRPLVALVGALALLAALPMTPASAATEDVSIHDFQFDPASLVASVGVKVRWTHSDYAPHTATSAKQLPNGKPGIHVFGSGRLEPGDVFQRALPWAATFDYYCFFHQDMKGIVATRPTVRDASTEETAQYRVTWAVADPKAGTLFDVQVKAPGGTFTHFYRGDFRSKLFQPDQAGIWSFHARLVQVDGSRVTASTRYSPAASVDVSLS